MRKNKRNTCKIHTCTSKPSTHRHLLARKLGHRDVHVRDPSRVKVLQGELLQQSDEQVVRQLLRGGVHQRQQRAVVLDRRERRGTGGWARRGSKQRGTGGRAGGRAEARASVFGVVTVHAVWQGCKTSDARWLPRFRLQQQQRTATNSNERQPATTTATTPKPTPSPSPATIL